MPTPSAQAAPRRAILSVSDKTGLTDFARRLSAVGFELLSTGGTARSLRDAGLAVRDVSELTGFPEMLDGRVKTLHPKVHGGLLGRWGHAEHRRQMEAEGIGPIELVVVNLYPFEAAAARAASGGVELSELIENIDIGGPAMLRSGAKNYESVAVVTDPADYATIASEIESSGTVSLPTRWCLAQKVFERTAAYDAAISAALSVIPSGELTASVKLEGDALPERLRLTAPRRQSLRYGENPHQRAALYTDPEQRGGIAQAELLQGKELSYNNLMDLEAAWELAGEFAGGPATVAIIKHTNPAGCAQGATLRAAYERALACDPVSAFGGVIGMNRELEADAAEAIAGLFVECIAAPGYTPEARARLAAKKNLRLLQVPTIEGRRWRLRSLSGGWLVQDDDNALLPAAGWKPVTRRAPTPEEEASLRFGWVIAKHVKSNAIVFARADGGLGQTLGVGAGQMSRVDSVKVAAMRAQLPLAGSVVASDAFFPFPDGIEEAARHGATAVIQPGGSVNDADAIATCDRLGLAMVFTGMRHFRH